MSGRRVIANTSELRQVPILELARELGLVIRNKKTICFGGHDRKTWSLHFYESTNRWYCFGCGRYGDTISLVRACTGLDFIAACQWIAERFDMGQRFLTDKVRSKTMKTFCIGGKVDIPAVRKTSSNVPDPELYTWLIDSCSLSTNANQYLTLHRGFKESTIRHFNIKDIPDPFRFFPVALKRWGAERLLKCGLAKDIDRKTRFIWFDHTILFPFYDLIGDVSYVQGRRVSGEPKYINPKGIRTEIFNLGALGRLTRGAPICICEGITDVLSATEGGLTAVGILGAHGFHKEWVPLFLDFDVTVIPDADSAGKDFFNRIQQAFRVFGKPIKRVQLKEGEDLSDFWRSRANNT